MEPQIMTLNIKDLIGRDTAVSSDDGDILFKNINEQIKSGIVVELDFSEISILTTAFLNSAIGQLYNIYSSSQLNSSIKLKNVAEDDKILFIKVIERAKEYFANKRNFEDSANKALYGN